MAFVHEALTHGRACLVKAGIASGSLDADLLLAHVLKLDRVGLVLARDRLLTTEELAAYRGLLQRRAAHEPVAYILGEREFHGLSFRVGPHTLIPRPDSETLVDTVLEHLPDKTKPLRLLDLGTGSGALLISLLACLPNAIGTGTDLSEEALDIARHNARLLNDSARVCFRQGNWFEALPEQVGRFDIIISNPPYIPTKDMADLMDDVRDYEPALALDGGEDGLSCYRRLIRAAPDFLASDGLIAFEVGQGQAEAVCSLLSEAFAQAQTGVCYDLAGIARVVFADMSAE